jgi:hypothetical protein
MLFHDDSPFWVKIRSDQLIVDVERLRANRSCAARDVVAINTTANIAAP